MRVFYAVWQVAELAAGYRYTTGRFTGQVGTILLFEEPMQPKAPRARVLLLQVQHVFEQWERQLVVGMGDGASPVVLKAFKPIALKGRNDRIYV